VRDPIVVTRPEIGRSTPVVLCGLVAVVALIGSLGGGNWERTAVEALIAIVAVVGLHLFSGNTGIISFGHPLFAAIGAYASTVLTLPEGRKSFSLPALPGLLARQELPWVVAAVVGALVATVVGVVLSIPLSRLEGIAASIATLAMLEVVHVVIQNTESITNGKSAIVGIEATTTVASSATMAAAAIVAGWWFQRSRAGRRTRAGREDERGAAALGIDVPAQRRWAFIASAPVSALVGSMTVHFLGLVNADLFFHAAAFGTIAMLVIGGLGSLSGAVIGAIGYVLVEQVLRNIEDGVAVGGLETGRVSGLTSLGIAALVLLLLAVRPSGITGGRELHVARPHRHSVASPASVPSPTPASSPALVPPTEPVPPTEGVSHGPQAVRHR
jgi:branched-chain amino acid transport system permease protein